MSRFKARFEAIYSICFVILPDVTCKLHSISLTHVYINSQIAFFQYCFFLLPFLNTDSFFLLLFVCRADYQYNPRGSSASVKKRILITHNLRLLKIKTKDLENHTYSAKVNGELFEGAGKFTLNGETKKDFLYLYNHTQNDKKKDYLDRYINNNKSNYKVTEVKYGDMAERSGSFDINFNFSIANAVSLFNNEMYIMILIISALMSKNRSC